MARAMVRQHFPYPITEVNRMIGDRRPDAPKKYTFTSPTFYKADSPLFPSGLLSAVKIIQSEEM